MRMTTRKRQLAPAVFYGWCIPCEGHVVLREIFHSIACIPFLSVSMELLIISCLAGSSLHLSFLKQGWGWCQEEGQLSSDDAEVQLAHFSQNSEAGGKNVILIDPTQLSGRNSLLDAQVFNTLAVLKFDRDMMGYVVVTRSFLWTIELDYHCIFLLCNLFVCLFVCFCKPHTRDDALWDTAYTRKVKPPNPETQLCYVLLIADMGYLISLPHKSPNWVGTIAHSQSTFVERCASDATEICWNTPGHSWSLISWEGCVAFRKKMPTLTLDGRQLQPADRWFCACQNCSSPKTTCRIMLISHWSNPLWLGKATRCLSYRVHVALLHGLQRRGNRESSPEGVGSGGWTNCCSSTTWDNLGKCGDLLFHLWFDKILNWV